MALVVEAFVDLKFPTIWVLLNGRKGESYVSCYLGSTTVNCESLCCSMKGNICRACADPEVVVLTAVLNHPSLIVEKVI
ncbi:hypothetical protein TNCT_529881 [Trichonephila clavata]|uniref:Uncharacterized protein n=1 Tax=Trichonephila clavata TaxID=2740835 RepID=A0A8X6LSV4_TRICU|nr:hypothetical protein TNCT_529881 [Trichonephila clavata]